MTWVELIPVVDKKTILYIINNCSLKYLKKPKKGVNMLKGKDSIPSDLVSSVQVPANCCPLCSMLMTSNYIKDTLHVNGKMICWNCILKFNEKLPEIFRPKKRLSLDGFLINDYVENIIKKVFLSKKTILSPEAIPACELLVCFLKKTGVEVDVSTTIKTSLEAIFEGNGQKNPEKIYTGIVGLLDNSGLSRYAGVAEIFSNN